MSDHLSKLSDQLSCSINLSHKLKGTFLLVEHSPEMKCYFHVLMALSEALTLCTCGGVNWYLILCSLLISKTSWGASLSNQCVVGQMPRVLKIVIHLL